MLVSLRLPEANDARVLAVDSDGRWRPAESRAKPDLGEGWWAVPGLADAHAHLGGHDLGMGPTTAAEVADRAYASLRGGTFLVVDKGWSDGSVIATLSALPPSRRPRFQGAARMIASSGGYYPDVAIETDEEGLAEVVRAQAAAGEGWVKLVGDWPRKGKGAVSNFDPDALATAVGVAHNGGARVAIHTMAPEVPSMAVAAGVDSIEHGLFLTGHDLDELGARGGAWVPTVLRMEAIADSLGEDSSGGRLIRRGLRNVADLLADAPESVAVLAGSDLVVPSEAVGAEAAALVRYGLSPERAVAAATTGVGSHLGLGGGFEPGEPADAVFFQADPLELPSALGDPVAVVHSGIRLR